MMFPALRHGMDRSKLFSFSVSAISGILHALFHALGRKSFGAPAGTVCRWAVLYQRMMAGTVRFWALRGNCDFVFSNLRWSTMRYDSVCSAIGRCLKLQQVYADSIEYKNITVHARRFWCLRPSITTCVKRKRTSELGSYSQLSMLSSRHLQLRSFACVTTPRIPRIRKHKTKKRLAS